MVSHLILARVSENALTWDYAAPLVATASVTFLEMSGEYAVPQPDLAQSVFLYRFTCTLPNGFSTTWLYTSYEANVIIGPDTYTPRAVHPQGCEERADARLGNHHHQLVAVRRQPARVVSAVRFGSAAAPDDTGSRRSHAGHHHAGDDLRWRGVGT